MLRNGLSLLVVLVINISKDNQETQYCHYNKTQLIDHQTAIFVL
jgi:hypothetical protein